MSEPKKQEKDYTKEVDEALPEAKSLAEVCGIDETSLRDARREAYRCCSKSLGNYRIH